MSPTTLAAYATTILLVAGAVYITYKHKNDAGFWYGVLALALLGSYIKFNSSMTSIKVGAPVDDK